MGSAYALLILGSSLGHAKLPKYKIAASANGKKALGVVPLIWGDIAKKDLNLAQYCPDAKSGEVCRMNQYHAEKYCKDNGKRLPTAREQAKWSKSRGAKGILETASSLKDISAEDDKVDKETEAKKAVGYRAIYQKNNRGQIVVDFYFNPNGYKPPSGDLGKYWTWSSSVVAYDSDSAYVLNGIVGNIGNASRSEVNNAVRCVVDR